MTDGLAWDASLSTRPRSLGTPSPRTLLDTLPWHPVLVSHHLRRKSKTRRRARARSVPSCPLSVPIQNRRLIPRPHQADGIYPSSQTPSVSGILDPSDSFWAAAMRCILLAHASSRMQATESSSCQIKCIQSTMSNAQATARAGAVSQRCQPVRRHLRRYRGVYIGVYTCASARRIIGVYRTCQTPPSGPSALS